VPHLTLGGIALVAGSGLEFADAGGHELRGIPGTWQLYRAVIARL
jgi:hypothetical protein